LSDPSSFWKQTFLQRGIVAVVSIVASQVIHEGIGDTEDFVMNLLTIAAIFVGLTPLWNWYNEPPRKITDDKEDRHAE
jgi:hypothetical protein